MSEPLTEAQFVQVTARDAFQRFGRAGAVRVLLLLIVAARAAVLAQLDKR